jgi:hypothetical protein
MPNKELPTYIVDYDDTLKLTLKYGSEIERELEDIIKKKLKIPQYERLGQIEVHDDLLAEAFNELQESAKYKDKPFPPADFFISGGFEFLQELHHQGHPIAIVTNATKVGSLMLRFKLNQLGIGDIPIINDLVRTLDGSSSKGASNRMSSQAFEKCGFEIASGEFPKEVSLVGDGSQDIHQAIQVFHTRFKGKQVEGMKVNLFHLEHDEVKAMQSELAAHIAEKEQRFEDDYLASGCCGVKKKLNQSDLGTKDRLEEYAKDQRNAVNSKERMKTDGNSAIDVHTVRNYQQINDLLSGKAPAVEVGSGSPDSANITRKLSGSSLKGDEMQLS